MLTQLQRSVRLSSDFPLHRTTLVPPRCCKSNRIDPVWLLYIGSLHACTNQLELEDEHDHGKILFSMGEGNISTFLHLSTRDQKALVLLEAHEPLIISLRVATY